MITNEKERKICEKYSSYDDTGHVRCDKCPLRKGQGSYDFRCKANSHYNRKTKEWEWDDAKEVFIIDDAFIIQMLKDSQNQNEVKNYSSKY